MKRLIIVLMLLSVLGISLYAQQEIRQEKQIIVLQGDDVSGIPGINLKSKNPMLMNMMPPEVDESGYFGITVSDLDFPTAQQLNYPYMYGVVVLSVSKESPAWISRMQSDDIIMYINDMEVTNQGEFDRIRKNLRPDDKVALQIWRGGSPTTMEVVLGTRTPANPQALPTSKIHSSTGYGGGSWVPMWFITDMDDVNQIRNDLGFTSIGKEGIYMSGASGKLSVGKGFFLGGFGVSAEDDGKVADATDPTYQIWMKYSTEMGGFTIDKRFPLAKNFVGSIGVVLGSGSHKISIMRSNADYSWPAAGTAFSTTNSIVELSRDYLVVLPRAELMYRLTSWLGLRAEVGYAYGYAPHEGWRVKGMNGDSFDISGSPDTKFQGINFSIGPWFGF